MRKKKTIDIEKTTNLIWLIQAWASEGNLINGIDFKDGSNHWVWNDVVYPEWLVWWIQT